MRTIPRTGWGGRSCGCWLEVQRCCCCCCWSVVNRTFFVEIVVPIENRVRSLLSSGGNGLWGGKVE